MPRFIFLATDRIFFKLPKKVKSVWSMSEKCILVDTVTAILNTAVGK